MGDSFHEKVQLLEKRFYSESFKRSVCEEYLRTGVPKDVLKQKYGIKGKSAILDWLRKFGYLDEKPTFKAGTTQVEEKETNQDVQARIQELEKLLESAQLEKQALELLIKVAESELKIDIRKKSVTKQSKK